MQRALRVIPATALAAVMAAPGAFAQGAQFERWAEGPGTRPPAAACDHLRSLTGYEFSIDAAAVVPAEGETPEFCLVQGLIQPEVRFEVGLPKDWNGRLYMFGNGGFAGEPFAAPGRVNTRNAAIRRGFATAATNTGHDAAREPLATFAATPQKVIDYAYRAVHVTALTAKALVRAYYAAPVQKSYFIGCSTGGRQGLISAQRFPEDFDGIVVGAPVLDFTGTMLHSVVINRALASAPLPAEGIRLLAERIYEKCDAADGLADGLIDDPRRCAFNPAVDVPQCGTDASTSPCLTGGQVKALEAIYGGVTANGERIFPGFPVGAEALVPGPSGRRSGWHPWIVAEGQQPLALQYAESFFKEMVTPGTSIDWREFEPDRDMQKLAAISTQLNATNPDLTRFRARGGKILMYFGWADPALNPLMGVDYYEQVRQAMGGETGEFFRLFMMPGVLHCSGGLGPSSLDTITPLVQWVERGVAPDRLPAALRQGANTIRTRPLCPYPMVAKYAGTGSVDDEASFRCGAPAEAPSPKQ